MLIPDVNVVLNAMFAELPFHTAARDWFAEVAASGERVGIPGLVFLGVVRIGTNARAFPMPLTVDQALEFCDAWRALPGFVQLEDDARLWLTFRTVLGRSKVAGPAVTDAYLASIAIRHDATLITFDRSFARFPDLKWIQPQP